MHRPLTWNCWCSCMRWSQNKKCVLHLQHAFLYKRKPKSMNDNHLKISPTARTRGEMWDREKPPLRKGRCQPNRLTEGSLGSVSIVLHWWLLLRLSDPSVKNRRFLTAPLTQGSFFAVDGPYYTFDVSCKEQRAMPAK